MSAEATAKLFFDGIVRHYGLPDEVLHDRDPRFTAAFWKVLGSRAAAFVEGTGLLSPCVLKVAEMSAKAGTGQKVLGSRAVFSSAYHPQTDGRTERMHHTIE